MEKNIKDYLHLYLGCQIKTEDGIGEFCGFIPSFDPFTVKPESGIMNDAIRVYYDKSVHNEKGAFCFGFYDIAEVKPILRPLSSMTEEEAKMYGMWNSRQHLLNFINDKNFGEEKASQLHRTPKQFAYLLSKHFDLFGLIESGLAIDATKEAVK